MKKFIIPATWEVYGNIEVIAHSKEDAEKYVNKTVKDIGLSEDLTYVKGSCRVSKNNITSMDVRETTGENIPIISPTISLQLTPLSIFENVNYGREIAEKNDFDLLAKLISISTQITLILPENVNSITATFITQLSTPFIKEGMDVTFISNNKCVGEILEKYCWDILEKLRNEIVKDGEK